MEKKAYVYLMANSSGSVIYTGVTTDLLRRVHEHKNKLVKGFTASYNVNKLVFYEVFDCITDAIVREKQIKAGSRAKKRSMVEAMNPDWKDLYEDIQP